MINEIILMNGYGLYVWSSFSFTFISFGLLFFVTKLQLIKQQRKFAQKFKKLDFEKVKAAKINSINKEILIGTLNSKI
jgi:heme exporter protein D